MSDTDAEAQWRASYECLADTVIDLFNPPDGEAAEEEILVAALVRVHAYVDGLPCECLTESVTDPNVLAEPCTRCQVLGRRADRPEER